MMKRAQNVFDFIYVVLFFVLSLAPFIYSFSYEPEENFEKRKLLEYTNLNLLDDYSNFPSQFDEIFRDEIAFRDVIVKYSNYIKYKYLMTSDSESVISGKNGWLFYDAESVVESYMSCSPFPEDELEMLKDVFSNEAKLIHSHSADYFFLIPPDKHSVYSENLPEFILQCNGVPRRKSQFSDILDEIGVKRIEIGEDLEQAKLDGSVYYKYDTHWNFRGAYAAYEKMMSSFGKGYEPVSVQWDCSTEARGDLTGMLGINDMISEENCVPIFLAENSQYRSETLRPGVSITVNDNPVYDETVMIIHDSYTNFLAPFFYATFNKVVLVAGFNTAVDESLLVEQEPDIFVREMVERVLMSGQVDPR